MRPTDILDKSAKGQEEIRTRKHKLAGKPRMLLLLIDGRHPVFVLREQSDKLGLPADTLDQLVDEGFVEVAGNAANPAAAASREAGALPADHFERYTAARRLMTESIFSALGLKSFLFNLKIEKTANRDDLNALMPEYERLMTKGMSADGAAVFVKRLRELLA